MGAARVVNLQLTKVYVFSDSVLCLGKIFENSQSNDAWEERLGWFKSSLINRSSDRIEIPQSNSAWEDRLGWFKSSPTYRNFDRIDGEPMEFEWDCSSVKKSKVYCWDQEKNQRISQDELSSCRCSTTFLVDQETMKKNASQMPISFLFFARRFGTGQWSFIGPGSEKKWYSISEDSPQGVWNNMAERMMLEFAESGHPIFRATSPLSRGQLKSKWHGKLLIHFAAVQETIETIFRIIVSANLLSLYGAVANMCEEFLNRFKIENNKEQEFPEVQFKKYVWKLDAKDFACRSKAKAKPQRREPAGSSPRTVPIGDRTWTDVELGEYSLSDYDMSKKLIHLRHGQHVHRKDWRIKENLQKYFLYCPHWSDDRWKRSMAGGGGNKKRYQYCTDSSGIILYFRALQGHSGRNLIDPTLQDNVVIPSNFFQYIYHVGCAIGLHSITNSGLILGGQKVAQQTDSILSACESYEQRTRRSCLHKSPWNMTGEEN